MYKLLPLSLNSPYVHNVCNLLIRYGGLIFSEIENPIGVFLESMHKNKVQTIIALKNDKFIAFCVLYNFKKISKDTFSCYMYGASERKSAKDLEILFPEIFADLKRQGCKVIRFETRVYNLPMRNLAVRLKFRRVGILENACYANKKFIDNILYEKTL